MRTKRTKRSSTYPMKDGGFLHLDRFVVPISLNQVECHDCGAKLLESDAAMDEGDLYFCWPCVAKWESKHKQDFFTGQNKPLTKGDK